MNTKKSRFQGLFEPQGNQPDQPVQKQGGEGVPPIRDTSEETLKERKEEFLKSRNQEGAFHRIKTNYEIRQDYVRAMKRIAVDEERKIYEVLEEAIGQYLEQRKQSKP